MVIHRRRVAGREPCSDLEGPRVAPTAAGERECLDRHLAALDAHLERTLGPVAQAPGQGIAPDELAMGRQQAVGEGTCLFVRKRHGWFVVLRWTGLIPA